MHRCLSLFAGWLLFATVAFAGPFPQVKVEKINDRLYALLGPTDVPNKENGGYMNNSLLVIGDKGAILVDAGSHRAVGEHIDRAIKSVTAKPVTHVLITHHHGDHHLGAEYFEGAKVIATEYCAKEIQDNGRGMVSFMSRTTGLYLGDARPVVPGERLASPSRKPMEIHGVKLELVAPVTAHTGGDLLVWLPDDGVLAAGDILVHGINPNFRDGHLKQWIGVVDSDILALPFKTVLPGHGPLMKRADVIEFRDLIAGFYQTVEGLYKSGGTEADVRKKLDMARWEKLARFEDMMGGNINKVWLEVEEANF